MRWVRAALAAFLLALLLSGCARSQYESAAGPAPVVQQPALQPPAPAEPVGQGQAPQPPGVQLPSPEVTGPVAAEPVPARVRVDQGNHDSWRPVTILDAIAPPGPATIRLTFSKPVRQQEVEQALLAGQSQPVRGLMQWEDSRTLIWQIAELPPRLDFLLAGAHDQDGLDLPGGIPSVRVGEPPHLVRLDLATMSETQVALLPPDIESAGLSPDGRYLNLTVWRPGSSRWDWDTADLYLPLDGGSGLKSGQMGTVHPRLVTELSNWSVSPQGTAVAGFRSPATGTDAQAVDLVITDLRGERQQVYPAFVNRRLMPGKGDFTSYLVWSPDGQQVAALHDMAGGEGAELVSLQIAAWQREVLVTGLPVQSVAVQLSWSADGRWILAGNTLIDLADKRYTSLSGSGDKARGVWEPGGSRLLYSDRDWDGAAVLEPGTGNSQSLGSAMVAGWAGPGQVYLIRWPSSPSRYQPPGS